MISLNISILFHLICIAFAVFVLRIFFDSLYDFFLNYKNEENVACQAYEKKKLTYLDERNVISENNRAADRELVDCVSEAIAKSKAGSIIDEPIYYDITVKHLSVADKLEIENNLKKILKQR